VLSEGTKTSLADEDVEDEVQAQGYFIPFIDRYFTR
jgi:hypothetical protein